MGEIVFASGKFVPRLLSMIIVDPGSSTLAIWLMHLPGRAEGSLIFLHQTIGFGDSDALDIKNLFMNEVSVVPVGIVIHIYFLLTCKRMIITAVVYYSYNVVILIPSSLHDNHLLCC